MTVGSEIRIILIINRFEMMLFFEFSNNVHSAVSNGFGFQRNLKSLKWKSATKFQFRHLRTPPMLLQGKSEPWSELCPYVKNTLLQNEVRTRMILLVTTICQKKGSQNCGTVETLKDNKTVQRCWASIQHKRRMPIITALVARRMKWYTRNWNK